MKGRLKLDPSKPTRVRDNWVNRIVLTDLVDLPADQVDLLLSTCECLNSKHIG